MALSDKIHNAAEQGTSEVEVTTGRLTANEKLEAEGQADQAAAKAKKVGEDVKDVFR